MATDAGRDKTDTEERQITSDAFLRPIHETRHTYTRAISYTNLQGQIKEKKWVICSKFQGQVILMQRVYCQGEEIIQWEYQDFCRVRAYRGYLKT